jgi:hypothetical protein
MGRTPAKKAPMHFDTMVQAEVPQGRNGKHKLIVSTILRDLDQLRDGAALKVPLAELAETKEKVRSALNRATRKASRRVATATDEKFLYVWNVRD